MIVFVFTLDGRYELNKLTLLPMCGFIAQLVYRASHRYRGGLLLSNNLLTEIGKFTAMIILHFQ